MTLRQTLGADIHRVYEQLEALLDKEDGVVTFFDGERVVTYTQGFALSASQLELLGVELERTLRNGVGRQAAGGANKRRNHEGNQRARDGDRVDRHGGGAVERVFRLARKSA
jgi:hypothetical protein